MLAFALRMSENVVMTEIQPRSTYSPNGVLEIQSDFGRMSEEQMIKVAQALSELTAHPGVTYQDEGFNLKTCIEIKNALGLHPGRDDFSNFLFQVGQLMPLLFDDRNKDAVVEPVGLCRGGFIGGVHEHFQRWLNTQVELDERVAQEVLQAMAVPFGSELEKETKRQFRLSDNLALAGFLGIAINDDDFGIYSYGDVTKGNGNVRWGWANLATVGKGACIGVNEDDRKLVDVSSDHPYPWLYRMTPRNVESSQQSLSLLLGMSAMAYHASQYDGREDILTDARWS